MPTLIEKDPAEAQARIAARLPIKSRRKMEHWRTLEEEATLLLPADVERTQELKANKGKLQRQIAELETADSQGKLYKEKRRADPKVPGGYHIEVERDTSRLDAARAELNRIDDQLERLNVRRSQRGNTPLAYVEAYLKALPAGTAFAEYEGPAAKPNKNETFIAAVERVRSSIDELRHEVKAINLAPIPAAEAKRRVRAEIEKLANHGRPELLNLIERAGRIRWPVFSLRVADRDGHIPQIVDAVALIAWLHKDQLLAALDRELDEFAEDEEGALTDEQRIERLNQLAGEILTLEYVEESLIEAAEREAVVIARRPDADPRALLWLADSLPAPSRRAA